MRYPFSGRVEGWCYAGDAMKNRSVPTNIMLPHIVYRNVAEASVWLSEAFGFVEHFRYGDPEAPSGAQMHLGEAWIMLHELRDGTSSPAKIGVSTQSLTIFVDDVEAHFDRAVSKGAKIVEMPHETVYGEFQYAAEDLDGHLWIFSRHASDLSPDEWGATVAP
jgi:uncharacterized glyoxalase superfamily protein PhnB